MAESTLSEDELKRFGYDLCILTITLTENYPICLKSITLMFDTLATNLAIDVYPLHMENIPSTVKEIVNPKFVLNNPNRKYKKFSEELRKPLDFNEEKFQHVKLLNFLNRVVLKSIRITNIYEKLKSGYFSNFSRNAHNVKSTNNPNANKKEQTPYFDQLRKVVLSMLNDIEPFIFSINCLKILLDSFIEYKSQKKESKRIYFRNYLPDAIYYIYNLMLLLKDVRNFLDHIPAPESFLLNGMKRREMLNITGTFLDYINKIGQMTDNFQKYCIKHNYLAKIYTNNVLFQTWCHHSKLPCTPNICFNNLKNSVVTDLIFLQKKEPPNIIQSQFFKKKFAPPGLVNNEIQFDEASFFKEFVSKVFLNTASDNRNETGKLKTKQLSTNEEEKSEVSSFSESSNIKGSNLYNEFIDNELPYQYPKITSFLSDNRFYRSSSYSYLLILLKILGFSFSNSKKVLGAEESPENNFGESISSSMRGTCKDFEEAKRATGEDIDKEYYWDSLLKKCDSQLESLSNKLLMRSKHSNSDSKFWQAGVHDIPTVLNAMTSFKFTYAYAFSTVLVSFNSILLIASDIILDEHNFKRTDTELQESSEIPGLNSNDYLRLALYGSKFIAGYAALVCFSSSVDNIKQSQESMQTFYKLFEYFLFTEQEKKEYLSFITSMGLAPPNEALVPNPGSSLLDNSYSLASDSSLIIDPKKIHGLILGTNFGRFLKILQFLSFRLLSIPASQQEWLIMRASNSNNIQTAKQKQLKELEYIILKDEEIINLNSDFWAALDQDIYEQPSILLSFYRKDLFFKLLALKLNKFNLSLNKIIDIVKENPDCFLHIFGSDFSSSRIESDLKVDKNNIMKRGLDKEIQGLLAAFIEFKALVKSFNQWK